MASRIRNNASVKLLQQSPCMCNQITSISIKRRNHLIFHLAGILASPVRNLELADQIAAELKWVDDCRFAVKPIQHSVTTTSSEPRKVRRARMLAEAECYVNQQSSPSIAASDGSVTSSFKPNYYIESQPITP